MPKIGEVGECPMCFGRLIPLSMCRSCNSVVAREGLEEVGPQIDCGDCGASNPTGFVCRSCTARFPFEEIVKPEGPSCPICKSPISSGVERCTNCGASLVSVGPTAARPLRRRVRGEFGEADVHEISRIPGVSPARAEALCAAGYNALWKISRATLEELGRLEGIGPRGASEIKESLRFLLLINRPKGKEEILSEEYECPLCATLTSLFSSYCHDCGAAFDEEELDEEFRKEVRSEEDRGLLAYYDVRLLEEPQNVGLHYARGMLLLSIGSPAGALASLDRVLELRPGDPRALQAKARALAGAKGVSAAAQVLHDITMSPGTPSGSAFEEAVEETEEIPATQRTEAPSCPACGARYPEDATACPACGLRFKVPEQSTEPAIEDIREDRLLEELERAVAGETTAPPPPLKPEIPQAVVDGKRSMLSFLLGIPGVSRRASEAVSGFFQDVNQIALIEPSELAELPGVAPAEARLIGTAVNKFLGLSEPPASHVEEKQPAPPSPEEKRPVPTSPVTPPRGTQPKTAPSTPPRPKLPETLKPPTKPVARPPPTVTSGRRGLINGRGLVNGRGRVNGLINGTGFVNGSVVTELWLPRRNLMPRYVAIGSSMLMLFALAAAIVPVGEGEGPIQIDGRFGDWQSTVLLVNGTTSGNDDVTVAGFSVHQTPNDGALFAHVLVEGNAFGDPTGWDTLYAFVDADGNATTGYDLFPIGADYVAQVSGSDGTVEDSRLFRFGAPDRENWNGWKPIGSVTAAAAGGHVELSMMKNDMVGFDATRFRALALFDDNSGAASQTIAPIGPAPGVLFLQQKTIPSSATVSVGASQALLEVELRALGSPVTGQVLLRTGANGTYPVRDIPFNIDENGVQRVTIFVDTSNVAAESLVSAGVAAVVADRPYAIAGVDARAYVTRAPPTPKTVDGIFTDWPNPQIDSADPVTPSRPSLDLRSRDGAVVGSTVFLYAQLGGTALEGDVVPRAIARPPPGGGTGGSGSPVPPPPPIVGHDYVRFYLDSNASEPGGDEEGGLFVDRYVEVRGRGGRVVDAGIYQWSGSDWRRDGTANVGLGAEQIELSASIPASALNMTRLLAVTADWSGVADRSDPTGTRGHADEGTLGAPERPVVLDVSGNGPFWFRHTSHSTETACTHNKVASSTRGSGPPQTITLSTGESACWYVDATTGQTIPTGTWETLLDLSNTGGADYDVRIEIWNLDANTVAETIHACPNQTGFGDDIRCFADSVAEKTLTSDQVVRLVFAHSAASGTVTIEYDDSDASGDSRATLPIPEFPDIAASTLAVISLVLVARAWRRRRATVLPAPQSTMA